MTKLDPDQRKQPVRMQDVAEQAGVSLATVSRVMKGNINKDGEVYNTVINVSKKLGYKRLRREPKANTDKPALKHVALLMTKSILDHLYENQSIFHSIISSVLKAAEEAGIHLVVSACDPSSPEVLPHAIQNGHVDGAIVAAHLEPEHIQKIQNCLPVVLFNTYSPWQPFPSVLVNNDMVMFKAIEHLAELEHRRIAYFEIGQDESNNSTSVHITERRRAYFEALKHFGLENDPELCREEDFGYGEHGKAISARLDKWMALDKPPTAVITHLNYCLPLTIEAAKRKISIPKDLSILGTDDYALSTMITPNVTTISCNYEQSAEIAIKTLTEILNNSNAGKAPQSIRVAPELIVRDSTGPAKVITE